jgi:hypothetical protein
MSPTVLIPTIIGILIGFSWVMFIEKDDWSGSLFGGFAGAVIGFFIGGFIWIIIGIAWETPTVEKESSNHRGIVSLKDGKGGPHGVFFLGCGAFSSGMEYYAYEDLGNKRFRMASFYPSRDIVIEDIREGETPYFVEINEVTDRTSTKWEWRWWMAGPSEDRERFVRWEIHIPPGTILKDTYELDLED